MITQFKRYWHDISGVAATEAGLIFPILLVLLLGTFDMGNGILTAQKTIRASQVTADLIARSRTISTDELDEAILAGQLALQPFNTASYGVDVASIRFDEDENAEIVWRETRNMSANDSVLTDAASLSGEDSGVIAVSTQYTFTPIFSGFVVGEMLFQEVAYARGRRSAVVNLE